MTKEIGLTDSRDKLVEVGRIVNEHIGGTTDFSPLRDLPQEVADQLAEALRERTNAALSKLEADQQAAGRAESQRNEGMRETIGKATGRR